VAVAAAQVEDRLNQRNVLVEARLDRTQQRAKVGQVLKVLPQKVVWHQIPFGVWGSGGVRVNPF
jgi:hypothetical protein